MTRRPLLCALMLAAIATPAMGMPEISLPVGAAQTSATGPEETRATLPSGPWRAGTGADAIAAEGLMGRYAWRIGRAGATPLQLMRPVRDGLTAAGFEPVYECADRTCGGFDFRYQLDLIPEPEMHVDLGDYLYLLMSRDGGEGTEWAAVVTSRSTQAGFVHLTYVAPSGASGLIASEPETPRAEPAANPEQGPEQTTALPELLQMQGFAVLEGLEFAPGSSDLSNPDYAGLEAVSAYLAARPEVRLAIVGHTDSVGGLDSNRRLSQARAEAVRARLIQGFGVAPERLDAHGVGYLSPRDSNASEEGRAQNRRVEVILLAP